MEQKHMGNAIELAYQNVMSNNGGPFGAIVVKDGEIIGTGQNQVTATNDPTAHAEVQAIRQACKHLNQHQLIDCEIYTSCEPCPMCIGAIYWARPKAVYYAFTKKEAADIGFDDQFIYEELSLPMHERSIEMKQIIPFSSNNPFEAWKNSTTKINY
jgi:guanine deaminase